MLVGMVFNGVFISQESGLLCRPGPVCVVCIFINKK